MKNYPIININGQPYAVVSINVIEPGGRPTKLNQALVDRILAGDKRYTYHSTRTGRWAASKSHLSAPPNAQPPVAHTAFTTTKKAVSMPAKSTLNPHQKIAAKLSPGAKAVLKAATATSTVRADLQKNSGIEGRQFAPALRRLVNTGCLTASGEGDKAKFKRSATGNKVYGTLPA